MSILDLIMLPQRCTMMPLVTVKRGWNMLLRRCAMQSHCKKRLDYVDRTLYHASHCKINSDYVYKRCTLMPLVPVRRGKIMLMRSCTCIMQVTVKRGWNMLIRRCAMQVTVKRGWIMLI